MRGKEIGLLHQPLVGVPRTSPLSFIPSTVIRASIQLYLAYPPCSALGRQNLSRGRNVEAKPSVEVEIRRKRLSTTEILDKQHVEDISVWSVYPGEKIYGKGKNTT